MTVYRSLFLSFRKRLLRENKRRKKNGSDRNSVTKKTIEESIERNKEKYIETSHDIHANPEIGNQEFYASRTLSLLLGSAGFQLQHNIAGHETGFIARKSSGKQGPAIAFLAEYDALPDSVMRVVTI